MALQHPADYLREALQRAVWENETDFSQNEGAYVMIYQNYKDYILDALLTGVPSECCSRKRSWSVKL